jgi:hypothetical protein
MDNNNAQVVVTTLKTLFVDALLLILYWITDFTSWMNTALVCKSFRKIVSEELNRRKIIIPKAISMLGRDPCRIIVLPCGRCCLKTKASLKSPGGTSLYFHIHFDYITKTLDGIVRGPNRIGVFPIREIYYIVYYRKGIKDGKMIEYENGDDENMVLIFTDGKVNGSLYCKYDKYDKFTTIRCNMNDNKLHGEYELRRDDPSSDPLTIKCNYIDGKLDGNILIQRRDIDTQYIIDSTPVHSYIGSDLLNIPKPYRIIHPFIEVLTSGINPSDTFPVCDFDATLATILNFFGDTSIDI